MLQQLNLDDETFAVLVERARLSVNEYFPAWSDLNTHDPGITLIELFAWLTEQQRFFLDQSEEASVFFPLLCITPYNAAAAEVAITIKGGFPSKYIPANTPLYAADLRFETTEEIYYTGEPLTITVVQRETVRTPFTLGHAYGFPFTRFAVDTHEQIILRDSFFIEVDGVAWTLTNNFHMSGANDRHYTLDEQTGELSFGNGIHGAMPNGEVTVTAMAVTLGFGGNIASQRINELDGLPVIQPMAGEGGRNRETVAETTSRVWTDHRRAVTAHDIEQIVLEIPELQIQIECIHAYEDSLPPRIGSPRTIQIAVKLKSGEVDDCVKKLISESLEPYRLVCREFRITAPKFVRVDLSIELRIGPHSPVFTNTLERNIREYFTKLYGGFGVKLMVSQIRAFLSAIPEVLEIYRCFFRVHGDARTDTDGNVSLLPQGLAQLGEVSLRIINNTTDGERRS